MGVYDQSGRYALYQEPQPAINHIWRQRGGRRPLQGFGLGPRPPAIVEAAIAATAAEIVVDATANANANNGLEAVPWTFEAWADTRSIVLPKTGDRTSDLASVMSLLGDPSPWLWIWEIQALFDLNKLDVLFEEVGHFKVHATVEGSKCNIMPVLVILKGKFPPDGHLDMTFDGFGHGCTYLVWVVDDEDARAILAAIEDGRLEPSMLYWVPLMANGNQPDVVDWWKRLLRQRVQDRSQQGDFILIALSFADLVDRGLVWEPIKEKDLVTESAVINEFVRDAWEQAELQTARQYLIDLLTRKFGDIASNNMVQTVNSQTDLGILRTWFNDAIDAASWERFMSRLRHG